MDTPDYSTYTNEQLMSVLADELSKAPIDEATFLQATSTPDLEAIANGVEGAREAAEQKFRENTFRMHTEGMQFTGDDERDYDMFRFAEAHGMFDNDVSAADVVKGFGRGMASMAKGAGSILWDTSLGVNPLVKPSEGVAARQRVVAAVVEGTGAAIQEYRAAWAGLKYLLHDNDDIEGNRRAQFEFIKKATEIEEQNRMWHDAVTEQVGSAANADAVEIMSEFGDITNYAGGFAAKQILGGAVKTQLGQQAVKRMEAALTGNVRKLSVDALDAEAAVIAATTKLNTTRKVFSDGKALEASRKALAEAKNARTAANDALSAAMSSAPVGMTRRAASGTLKTAGNVVEGTGELLHKTRVAVFGGDEISEGVAAAASGGAMGLLRSSNIITKVGRDTRVFGETLATGRATLPYFRRLAANQGLTKGSRWASNLIDKSQTAWLGRKVVEGGKALAPGAAMSGSFGYLASGGDIEAAAESAGAGGAFGISGGAYGAWQAYQTPGARIEELQANRNVYLQSLSSRPDGSGRSQREMFERLRPHEQLMIGTFAQAHPDLAWRFDPTLKPAESGAYNRDTNEITVNPNSKDPIKDIFAHEVAHGIETHGVGAHARTLLIGNAETGQVGEYTQLDDAGAPITRDDGTLETTNEFKALKQTYADLLDVDVNTITDQYMASELFAEHYADRLIGGGIIRDLRQSPVDRIVDALGNASITKDLMGHLGLTFNQADRVVGSGVFKDLRRSRAVDRLAKDWNKDRAFGKPLPEREEADTVLGEKELRDKKLAKKWAGSGGFIQVDSSGNPVYKSDGTPVYITPKQAEAQQQLLGHELQVALDEYLAENPDTDAVRLQTDAGGKQIYVGNHLPDEVIERLEASGQFNPTQIATLKAATATVKQNGLGAMILHFYQAASRKGRKGYKSVSGRWRRDAVYGFQLTQGGNIVLNTVSWERLFDNVRKAAKTKGARDIWGPDSLASIHNDVETYLENLSNGRPGAEGIGNAKRDFINNLFGYRTKGLDVNPWHDKTKTPVPFFTSLRLDRMNRLETLDTAQWQWGPDQNRDVKLNRRPETSESVVNPAARDLASKYHEARFGEPLSPHTGYDPLPIPQLQELADFLESQEHAPNDPEVQKSYAALAQETFDQYRLMAEAGVAIEPYEGDGEPYANSKEMVKDVTENNHLWFFMTDNGFGSGDQVADHPLMEKSGIMIGDRELLFNDLFRAVHDYFGHTQKGFQFGPRGEFNAWREHSTMFSPEAQGALAAETLAQNAWVNNGKHIRREDGTVPKKGEEGYVHPADRPFADQKAFIVPDEMIAQFRPETQEAGPQEELETAYTEMLGGGQARPESPEFKKWFGDSKVVDADGKPLVVYHGTTEPRETFEPDKHWRKGWDNFGSWFAANPDAANMYAANFQKQEDGTFVKHTGVIQPSFLKMDNPWELDAEKGGWQELTDRFKDRTGVTTNESKQEHVDEFRRYFRASGRDGVIIRNWAESPNSLKGDIFITLEPTQVKSAISNKGNFDPNDPNVSYRPETMDTIKAKVTKNGKLAFPVKGRKPLELVHYSKTANIEEIDPMKMKAKANVYSRMYRGINKSFFYTDGTKPHASENVNESFPYRYKAQIDGSKLYDFSKDEADLWFSPNPEVMEQGLKDAGYQGFYAETDDGRKFVALFHKMPVDGTEVIESDPIEGNVDGVEDFEEETEADRRYASWQRNKPKAFSANRPEAPNTPEFKKWFGDSKIVDTKGDPAVMYHHTRGVFTQFKQGPIFLTADPDYRGYNDFGNSTKPAERMELFARAENPFDINNPKHEKLVSDLLTPKDLARLKVNREVYDPSPLGVVDDVYVSSSNESRMEAEELAYSLGDYEIVERKEILDRIKSEGFDSFVVRENGQQNVAVFDPTQIKSAIGNNGNFDPNDANIQNRPETNSEFTTFPDDSEITEALSSDKEPFVGAHRDLEPGTPVGLRIDIPAFLRTGKYVVTVHEKAGSRVGKRLGYDGIAAVSDPTFFSNERGAEKIRDGNAKFPIATVEGRFDPSREIPADIDDWTAVGYNPKDHSYFYDKETDQPVVSGSQAVSVGNTVFVKDPVYGNVEDFAFRPETKASVAPYSNAASADGSNTGAEVPSLSADLIPNKRQTEEAIKAWALDDQEADAYRAVVAAAQNSGPEAIPLEPQYDKAGRPKFDKSKEEITVKVRSLNYDLITSPEVQQIRDKHLRKHENLLAAAEQAYKDAPRDQKAAARARVARIKERWKSDGQNRWVPEATDLLAQKIIDEYATAVLEPTVQAAEGWYSKMRGWLQEQFGAGIEVFSQLLGATSARTPVDENFKQALDALRLMSVGKYGGLMQRFHEHVEAARELYPDDADAFRREVMKFVEVPTRSNGKKFNANSVKVLHAVYGNWLEMTQGPKTPNFAGNLSGRTVKATIDVWAARTARRVLYQDINYNPETGRVSSKANRWRILPAAEGSVEHTRKLGDRKGGDFFFAQEAFQKAADELGVNADDLQAIMWFHEKHVWDQNGWTKAEGKKKSSFESEAGKLETERYQAGVTTVRDPDNYSQEEFDAALDEIRLVGSQIPGLVYLRTAPSHGLFGGAVEPSFDIELVVESGADVTAFNNKIKEIGSRADQDAVFVSKVSSPDSETARPGLEIGFRSAESVDTVQAVTDALRESGVDGFTIARNQQNQPIGVRAQFIPEFSGVEGEAVAEAATAWVGAVREGLQNLPPSVRDLISYESETFFETDVTLRD